METTPLRYIDNNKLLAILDRPVLTEKGYDFIKKHYAKNKA